MSRRAAGRQREAGAVAWRAGLRIVAAGGLPLFTVAGLLTAAMAIRANGYLDLGLNVLALATARRILAAFAIAWLAAAPAALGAAAAARRLWRRESVAVAALVAVMTFALAAAMAMELRPSPYWSTRAWEVLKTLQGWLGPLGSLIGRRAFRLSVLALACLAAGTAWLAILSGLLSRPAAAARVSRLLAAERLSSAGIFGLFLPAAVFAALFVASLAVEAGIPPAGPSVLLITVETLRADHLESYGHSRPTAPHLAALASRGALFRNAIAQAPWTLPSLATLHTGLYPREHGAIFPDLRLAERHTTLAERLRDASYDTSVISSWLFVSKPHGFGQGVAHFERLRPEEGAPERSAPEITRRAVARLRAAAGRRFFLWLHYVEPHDPYLDHEGIDFASGYAGTLEGDVDVPRLYRLRGTLSPGDLDHARDLYDEEIAFVDGQIGRVLAELDRLGLRERTLVVVAGDHGEEFGERGGFGHHHQIFQELIHVPLIIAEPAPLVATGGGVPGAVAARVVNREVELRDIARTILDRCGVPAPGVEGRNLLDPDLDAGAAESYAFSEHFDRWRRVESKTAVLGMGWKMIRDAATGDVELYDLRSDPGERRGLGGGTEAGGESEAIEAAADSAESRIDDAGVESGGGGSDSSGIGGDGDADSMGGPASDLRGAAEQDRIEGSGRPPDEPGRQRIAAALERELERFRRRGTARAEAARLGAEELERLKALGYVE